MKAYIQKVAPPSHEASFVFRVKADPRFARGWHFHPEYELTYIIESRGRRFVGDTIESYASGDCVLLGPNLPHTWRSDDFPGQGRARGRRPLHRAHRAPVHRAIVLQFREDFLPEAAFRAPELAAVAAVLKRSARGLQILGRTRDEVARRLLSMKRLDGLDRLLEIFRILKAIAAGGRDVLPISNGEFQLRPNASHQRRVDRVLDYLEARHVLAAGIGTVTQAEAARLAGMSASSFSRFFRKTTGLTFVGYLNELRVSRASSLLTETDLPVLQIALRSGYTNLSNFNRRFLALRGLTPRAYRSLHTEAAE